LLFPFKSIKTFPEPTYEEALPISYFNIRLAAEDREEGINNPAIICVETLLIIVYPKVLSEPNTFQVEPLLKAVIPITSVLLAVPVGVNELTHLTVTAELLI
jgi:hypothetical protein